MSPRAACRLEALGFTRVFDHGAGKADWIASGLPTEGRLASEPRAGDLAQSDPPTCGLSESAGEARSPMEAGGGDVCVVVDDPGCVLDRLVPRELRDPVAMAEAVM